MTRLFATTTFILVSSLQPASAQLCKEACFQWCFENRRQSPSCSADCASRQACAAKQTNTSQSARKPSAAAPKAQAEPPRTFGIKDGETIPIGSVYWVANCKSILKKFIGIDVLEGPAVISISLKPGEVLPVRQKCPDPVEGATVMVSAKGIKEAATSLMTFRVKYDTRDGERQSTHTIELKLYP